MSSATGAMIMSVASASAGVCTRAELRDAGLSNRTISRQAASGVLIPVGPGIYEVPALRTADAPYHRAAKAHPSGAISHRSAARLWGFPVGPAQRGEPVEVTVARSTGPRTSLTEVVVHRTRMLVAADIEEPRPGLRATGPTRTIVDLAGTGIGSRRLRHVVETAVVTGQVTLDGLTGVHARVGRSGVAGTERLGRLIRDLGDAGPIPQSELERRLADLLDPVGQGFHPQFRPPWYDGIRGVVDFAHPDSRVIVEADGRRWHASGQAMAEDRRRDRLAAAHGWVVLRVAWDDVVARPATIATEIATVVAERTRSAA